MFMGHTLNILLLEDLAADAELTLRELQQTGLFFAAQRVDTEASFRVALRDFAPHLILADYQLSSFDGIQALEIAKELCPLVPFLFVTGVRGEEVAVESIKHGASDYILKERLSRLGPAVLRSLAEAQEKTQRHEAAEALIESEEKFRRIAAAAQDALVILDEEGRITEWSTAAERMFQHSAKTAIGQDLHGLLLEPDQLPPHAPELKHFLASSGGAMTARTMELTVVRKDGSELPIELSVSAMRLRGEWNTIGMMRDISERKRAEKTLSKVNRALKTLSSGNEALVSAEDESQIVENMCEILVDIGGYMAAWVGFAGLDGQINVTTHRGADADKIAEKTLYWKGPNTPESLAGLAICTGEMHMIRSVEDPLVADILLQEAHGRLGSAVSFPLLDQDDVFGALTIYAAESNAFQQEELLLLEELSEDLAFGISTLRVRHSHERNREKLERSMRNTVQAIANTVEMRDPYTAGHQRRVAQLATAIAHELGLDTDRIRGLHLAGIVHDIGKIQIPAEILSKPGRLTDVEFRFIQLHSRAGYEILKDVEFPWPIKDIVLQHHERLDGSGYPHGLQGDEILLEARILCVADVVEAMASNRPYRAGLGLDVAFAEVAKHRGLSYDPLVVDACFVLFQQKGFAFS